MYIYIIFSLSFKSCQVEGAYTGEGRVSILQESAVAHEHASCKGRRAHCSLQSLQPQKNFKVTVAVFDCSLSVY